MVTLRNVGKRESELGVKFAREGVHPCQIDKKVQDALSKEINELWDNHKAGESTDKIDDLQRELTALRTQAAGPITLADNWCESDGQWWV